MGTAGRGWERTRQALLLLVCSSRARCLVHQGVCLVCPQLLAAGALLPDNQLMATTSNITHVSAINVISAPITQLARPETIKLRLVVWI